MKIFGAAPEVTAVFGGTFDPPHLGHREAVRGLFANPGVKRVLILPSANPPLKQTRTEAVHRIAMAKLCFSPAPGEPFPAEVEMDLREIERSILSPDHRPSYTWDTVQEMRRQIPNLAFVIGTDQLRDLKNWHRFPEVLGLCHWIVLERRPDGQAVSNQVLGEWEGSGLIRKSDHDLWKIQGAQGVKGSATWLKTVPTGAPAISSTAIREELSRSGKPPENTLSGPVLTYLNRNRLYGTSGPRETEKI